MEATKEISEQNLDFEVGHSNIKEFEDVLCSFSSMKDNLKSSLEKQWNAEKLQREQIAALAHDLKTPLTVIQGNADLIPNSFPALLTVQISYLPGLFWKRPKRIRHCVWRQRFRTATAISG